jgi:hypothetical protein
VTQVLITPHVSAVSFPQDVAEIFAANLERYLEPGTPGVFATLHRRLLVVSYYCWDRPLLLSSFVVIISFAVMCFWLCEFLTERWGRNVAVEMTAAEGRLAKILNHVVAWENGY